MNHKLHLTSFQSFIRDYRKDWASLNRQCGATPDQGPEWAQSLQTAHGIDAQQISVFAAEDSDGIGLIFPYRVSGSATLISSSRLLEPLVNVHCMHNRVLTRYEPADAASVLSNFLHNDVTWDVLKINKLDAGSESSILWNTVIQQCNFGKIQVMAKAPPFLAISQTWPEFLASKSSNFRYNLRRKRKKLAKLSAFDIRFFESACEFDSAFRDICAIEKDSWKASAGTAITSRKWELSFYSNIIPQLLHTGQALLTIIYLDGKPIAHDVSICSNDTAYCLKTSYHTSFDKLSPGVILREALLERVFKKGYSRYDFLGAGEAYKLGWATGTVQSCDLYIYNRSLMGRIGQLRSTIREYLGHRQLRRESDSDE